MRVLSGVVTKTGKTLDQVLISDVLKTALAYGKCYIVVDRMPVMEGLTQAEAEAFNSQPYIYVVPPTAAPAVSYDDRGELDRIIIHQTELDPYEQLEGFSISEREVYTLWEPSRVIKEDANGDLISVTEITTGKLMVLEFALNQSFFRNLYSSTIQALQHWSMSSTGAQRAVFGLPVIFSGAELKRLDMGLGKGLQLAQDDKFEIHTTETGIIEKNKELANAMESFIQYQLHQRIEEGANVYSTAKASGVSKARDKDSQEAFSAYLGEELSALLPRIVDLFAAYYGKEGVETTVVLPEKYVIQDPAEDRERAKAVSLDFTPETEAQFVAAKKVERKYFGLEDVMTEEEIAKDDKELETVASTRLGEIKTPNTEIEEPFAVGADE
jgi:hypothetical protein